MGPRRPLTRFERACLALIVVGLATRLLVFRFRHVGWDGMWYLTMGKSLVQYGEFLSPWIADAPHTRHFPPAYPALDALGYAIGGPTFTAAALVGIGVSIFLVAVALFTTSDLYGRARGFAVAAIVSTSTILIDLDLQLLSESLVVAFFALTIWGLLRSLDDPRYVLVAGLFAGLGYLTKASMGPFFLLAGAGGFAWRFYYVGLRVFRDKWYMGAGALFATFVLSWAWRNVRYHGWPNWETQPHANDAVRHLFSQPGWPIALGQELVWGAVVLAALGLAFLPELRASLRKIRDERTSALWLAVLTPSVIGLLFAASFASLEGRAIVTDTTIRYLITPTVPLLWLGVREMDFGSDPPPGAPAHGRDLLRGRSAWLAAGTGILAFLHFANPTYPFLSATRLRIYVVGCVLGLACLLVARAYAWRPAEREGGAPSWRATRAPIAGAPPVLLAIGALAFSIGIGLLVAHIFLALLIPLAASLAAGSPRARVLALCAIAAVVPFAAFQAQTALIPAAEDVNALASEGAAIVAQPGHEHFVYPFLRDDLRLVQPDQPHEWFLAHRESGEPGSPGPNHTLEREYPLTYVAAPGAVVGIALWGSLLDDAVEPPRYVSVRLYRATDPVGGVVGDA